MKTVGYIDHSGNYHRGEDVPMPHDVSTEYRNWSHMDQKKRHAKDIIQPYESGKINREFVQAYDGEVAELYFTKDQIRKSERSLS